MRVLQSKLVVSVDDKASGPLGDIARQTGRSAQAIVDYGRATKVSRQVDQLTKSLNAAKTAAGQVEDFRKARAAVASASADYKLAKTRADELGRSLDQARAKSKAMNEAMRARKGTEVFETIARQAARAAGQVKQLETQHRSAATRMRETDAALKAQTRTLEASREAMRRHGVPIMDLTKHQDALGRSISKTTDALRQQMRIEAEAARTAATAAHRADARAARRHAVGEAARAAGAGAGLYAGYKAKETTRDAIAAAAEFDIAVRKQEKFTDIRPQDQAELLAQAKKIGQETQFSNVDVVKAQTAAMQGLPAGFSSQLRAEVAQGIVENVKSFATLMETDLKDGAETIRSYLQATGKDISTKEKALAEANKATNQMVRMAKLGGMSGEDVAQYLKFAGSSATSAGLSPETMMTIGALARRGGLRGDEAGVFMRATASKLVSPTKKGRSALNAAGINYDDYVKMPERLSTDALERQFQMTMGKGFTPEVRKAMDEINANKALIGDAGKYAEAVTKAAAPILGKKKDGTVRASDSQSAAKAANTYRGVAAETVDAEGLLRKVFSSNMTLQQLNAFLTDKHGGKGAITQRQYDEFRASYNEIGSAGDDPDFAKKKADYVMAGLGGAVENLRGSVENLVLQIGEANSGLIKFVADGLGKGIDAFSKLDASTQQIVSLGAGAAAALGTLKASGFITGKLLGATALTGSAAELTLAAKALDAAAARLGAGGPASVAKSAATGAAAGSAAVVGVVGGGVVAGGLGASAFALGQTRQDPKAFGSEGGMLGALGYGFAAGILDAGSTPQPSAVERQRAELKAQRDKAADLEAQIKRLEASNASAMAGPRSRSVVDGQIVDLRRRLDETRKLILESVRKGAIDDGLDAIAPLARPSGAKVGEQAATGIAEGLRQSASKVETEGRTLFENVKAIFAQGISIPMRFDGAGGGFGGGGSGLINASYGGGDSSAVQGNFGGRALAVGSGSGVGHIASKEERAAYIREAARARGIDPEVALRVAQSEGFHTYTGDQGRSFGDWQLFTGGGLGNKALAAGINVRDPRTWKRQTDFALDAAKREGWKPWYGAAKVGVSRWRGINAGAPSMSRTLKNHEDRGQPSAPPPAAAPAPAGRQMAQAINPTIHIHSTASIADPREHARQVNAELQRLQAAERRSAYDVV